MYNFSRRAVGCSPLCFTERGPTAKQVGGESKEVRSLSRCVVSLNLPGTAEGALSDSLHEADCGLRKIGRNTGRH